MKFDVIIKKDQVENTRDRINSIRKNSLAESEKSNPLIENLVIADDGQLTLTLPLADDWTDDNAHELSDFLSSPANSVVDHGIVEYISHDEDDETDYGYVRFEWFPDGGYRRKTAQGDEEDDDPNERK